MFPRISKLLIPFMIMTLWVGSSLAVDLDTVAIVDIVEGIYITETSGLDFGDVAMNNGTVSISTGGVITDPSFMSYDPAGVSQGIFTVLAIAGASYDITMTETVAVVGLTLNNFRINIDGAADVVGANSFVALTLSNATSTMNLGADLTVASATASLGDNQSIGYRVSITFN